MVEIYLYPPPSYLSSAHASPLFQTVNPIYTSFFFSLPPLFVRCTYSIPDDNIDDAATSVADAASDAVAVDDDDDNDEVTLI